MVYIISRLKQGWSRCVSVFLLKGLKRWWLIQALHIQLRVARLIDLHHKAQATSFTSLAGKDMIPCLADYPYTSQDKKLPKSNSAIASSSY